MHWLTRPFLPQAWCRDGKTVTSSSPVTGYDIVIKSREDAWAAAAATDESAGEPVAAAAAAGSSSDESADEPAAKKAKTSELSS